MKSLNYYLPLSDSIPIRQKKEIKSIVGAIVARKGPPINKPIDGSAGESFGSPRLYLGLDFSLMVGEVKCFRLQTV